MLYPPVRKEGKKDQVTPVANRGYGTAQVPSKQTKPPEMHKTPTILHHEFREYQNISVSMDERHINGLLTDSEEGEGLDEPSTYL